MIHVVVVDDHALVRQGLKTILEREGDVAVVAVFGDGPTFLRDVRTVGRIDVLLLDVTLPTMDGISLLERVRLWRDPPPVVVLSMHPETTHAVKAIQAGAHGYLTKDADDHVVVDAVRTVAHGGLYLTDTGHQELLRSGVDARVRDPAVRSSHGSALDQLSDQELRVFRLLRRGSTVGEIANELDLASNTVSTYKARLMKKLGARTIVDLLQHGTG